MSQRRNSQNFRSSLLDNGTGKRVGKSDHEPEAREIIEPTDDSFENANRQKPGNWSARVEPPVPFTDQLFRALPLEGTRIRSSLRIGFRDAASRTILSTLIRRTWSSSVESARTQKFIHFRLVNPVHATVHRISARRERFHHSVDSDPIEFQRWKKVINIEKKHIVRRGIDRFPLGRNSDRIDRSRTFQSALDSLRRIRLQGSRAKVDHAKVTLDEKTKRPTVDRDETWIIFGLAKPSRLAWNTRSHWRPDPFYTANGEKRRPSTWRLGWHPSSRSVLTTPTWPLLTAMCSAVWRRLLRAFRSAPVCDSSSITDGSSPKAAWCTARSPSLSCRDTKSSSFNGKSLESTRSTFKKKRQGQTRCPRGATENDETETRKCEIFHVKQSQLGQVKYTLEKWSTRNEMKEITEKTDRHFKKNPISNVKYPSLEKRPFIEGFRGAERCSSRFFYCESGRYTERPQTKMGPCVGGDGAAHAPPATGAPLPAAAIDRPSSSDEPRHRPAKCTRLEPGSKIGTK